MILNRLVYISSKATIILRILRQIFAKLAGANTGASQGTLDGSVLGHEFATAT